MKVGIFYFSRKPGKDRQRIVIDGRTWGYIRVELSDKLDLGEALDQASPRPDEAVMNTHVVAS